MATVPERLPTLMDVLHTVLPHVAVLHLYLDGWSAAGQEVPSWLLNPHVRIYRSEDYEQSHGGRHLGDAGKFAGVEHAPGLYLALDDDLYYPGDWGPRMAAGVAKYRGVVSWHGCTVRGTERYYYQQRRDVLHCLRSVGRDTPVNVAGSGCSAFDVREVAITPTYCETANMADLWLGLYCQERHLPQVVLRHEKGELAHAPIDQSRTIHARYYNNIEEHAAVLRQWAVWQVFPLPYARRDAQTTTP